jgi:hypothetical protein
MAFRVSVRIDQRTGQFELFQVDDLGQLGDPAEHNDRHEQVAEDLGRLVARRPEVEEIPAKGVDPRALAVPEMPSEEQDEQESATDRDRRAQES